MANATIDNPPVSVQLDDSESVTVPSNETWKVTIACFAASLQADNDKVFVNLNFESFLGISGDMANGAVSSPSVNLVLAGDDTIEVKSFQAVGVGAVIQGFVVNS
jgi:hypothetical protein